MSNILMFVASFAFQRGIGAVLRIWPATDGHYPVEGYAVAFGIARILQLATLAWLMPLREKRR